MIELLKKWDEYTHWLAERDEFPQVYGGFYTFYWFMEWCKNGTLPGKRFQKPYEQ